MTAPMENETALTLDRIRAEVAEILGTPPAELADDEDLADHGLDSIRLMTLVERWRQRDSELTFAQFADSATIRDWHELMTRSR